VNATPTPHVPDLEDQHAAAILRARGFPITDIQSLARDQTPFAQRTTHWKRVIAPGVSLTARTVELREGFTRWRTRRRRSTSMRACGGTTPKSSGTACAW
jgi:hypothetical protein